MDAVLPVLETKVRAVAKGWFNLAHRHCTDASALDAVKHPRSVYSRAYYAAYSASKAVRYIVNGEVSLRGDDHKRIADLPDDFPNVAAWVSSLPRLYEHRLRADYDNWTNTLAENELSPDDCLLAAKNFIAEAQQYLDSKYGITL